MRALDGKFVIVTAAGGGPAGAIAPSWAAQRATVVVDDLTSPVRAALRTTRWTVG
jgi:NAD(P)-dependent dehydrogenase (short-subunit alcohol dehydrogenase family)